MIGSLYHLCVHVLLQADMISANLIHTAKEDILSMIQFMFSIIIFLIFCSVLVFIYLEV